jgi:Ca2+-transporting ATPase
VGLGRRIDENIRNAMSYLVAVHIPIAGLGLLPVLLGWPLVFLPVHVLFMEFVIDPACSFIFEADEAPANLMRRPPRAPDAPLFSRGMLGRSALLGAMTFAFSLGVYAVALSRFPEEQARALAFIALVLSNLLAIVVSRSHGQSLRAILLQPNMIFWGITFGTLAALIAVVFIPNAAALFRFAPPPGSAIAAVVGAAGAVLFAALALQSARGLRLRG